jgi:hypothetical protein
VAAPEGNHNYKKGKLWSQAIMLALDQRDPTKTRIEALTDVAKQLISQAASGDIQALKELADRIDGKATQDVIFQGGDEPILISLVEPTALAGRIRGLNAPAGAVPAVEVDRAGTERGSGTGET